MLVLSLTKIVCWMLNMTWLDFHLSFFKKTFTIYQSFFWLLNVFRFVGEFPSPCLVAETKYFPGLGKQLFIAMKNLAEVQVHPQSQSLNKAICLDKLSWPHCDVGMMVNVGQPIQYLCKMVLVDEIPLKVTIKKHGFRCIKYTYSIQTWAPFSW
jgi:hypothetical protein